MSGPSSTAQTNLSERATPLIDWINASVPEQYRARFFAVGGDSIPGISGAPQDQGTTEQALMPQKVLERLNLEADSLGLSPVARLKVIDALIVGIQAALKCTQEQDCRERVAGWSEFVSCYLASGHGEHLARFLVGLEQIEQDDAAIFQFVQEHSKYIVGNVASMTTMWSELVDARDGDNHQRSAGSNQMIDQVIIKIAVAWRYLASNPELLGQLSGQDWNSLLMVDRIAFTQSEENKARLADTSRALLAAIADTNPQGFGPEQLQDLLDNLAINQVGDNQLDLWLSLLSVQNHGAVSSMATEGITPDTDKLSCLFDRLSIRDRLKLAITGLVNVRVDKSAEIKVAVEALCTWAEQASDATVDRVRSAVVLALILETAAPITNNSNKPQNQVNGNAIIRVVSTWNEKMLGTCCSTASLKEPHFLGRVLGVF
jgi:hypothetical protein